MVESVRKVVCSAGRDDTMLGHYKGECTVRYAVQVYFVTSSLLNIFGSAEGDITSCSSS